MTSTAGLSAQPSAGGAWTIRDFHADDLDHVIGLFEHSPDTGKPPVFGLGEVVGCIRGGNPAVVASVGSELVGITTAVVAGDRAWLVALSLARTWRGRGLGSALLSVLERRLLDRGVRRIAAVLPPGETGSEALVNSGYSRRPAMDLFEKLEPLAPAEVTLLQQLGGRLLPVGLWNRIGGMDREKETVERRVVLPCAQPDLAQRYGLSPPRAIVLFGPPGTGKTTFAKAAASRLEWPFVELFPSQLAGADPNGAAGRLRDAFAQIAELEHVVVFIDEFEEIAAARSAHGPARAVTNEMLKLIPAFREHPDRLLVCATNAVDTLDPALLRPGRFDYLIPVGPPDPEARRSIWTGYLQGEVDLDAVVTASEMFTPADIEHAARTAAQAAFERAALHGKDEPVTTEDVLAAIAATRCTLTASAVEAFERDIDTYARL